MDWTRGAGHLESYGHDIECSWLIHEAALVLGDSDVLKKVEPIVQMVAKASEKGLRPDGSMIHEANLDTGHVDDDLHWWVQAENVVGWFNLYQYFDDEQALDRAVRCWQYIKDNLIDYENGEWHWSRHPDGTLNTVDDKAGSGNALIITAVCVWRLSNVQKICNNKKVPLRNLFCFITSEDEKFLFLLVFLLVVFFLLWLMLILAVFVFLPRPARMNAGMCNLELSLSLVSIHENDTSICPRRPPVLRMSPNASAPSLLMSAVRFFTCTFLYEQSLTVA